MTNMTNAHTLSIGRVDLLTALVLLSHGELVELTGDVVGGAGVAIPIGVHAIGHGIGTLFFLLFFFIVVGVAVPTLPGFMAWLATNLACDEVAVIAAFATTAASTRCIAAATASTTSAVATAASTPSSMMATSTWPASALRRVDGGASAKVVGEERDAVVVGGDLGVELGDGEVFPTVDPDGGEEGVVGLVEAGEEILNEFFLVDGPAGGG
jgi:hypothetical protein